VIAAIVIAALACGALAYVAAPLRASSRATPEPDFAEAELEGRKRAALTAIIDIENERDVGKLSSEDFDILRGEYETEAVAALLELDSLRAAGNETDIDLEVEIAAIRDRLAASGGRRAAGGPLLACPSCGSPRVPGRACETCGA
jgi:hypothetical protein